MNLKDEGIDIGLAIAGLFGAVLMSSKNSQSMPRVIVSLIGGAASSNYLTPVILKLTRLDPSEQQFSYAIAFLLGFCGLRAVEAISLRLITDEPAHSHKRHR